jgi:hypothetical protein
VKSFIPGKSWRLEMAHWQHSAPATDSAHDDDISYYGGWTISGLAVLATIGAVWVLGI